MTFIKSALNIFCIISIAIFLMSCKGDDHTYNFLMEHPDILKDDVSNCQRATEKTPQQVEQCRVVMTAAYRLVEIIAEQQANPEKFGQKVLDAEINCAKYKEELTVAQNNLLELKNKNVSTTELQAAEQHFSQVANEKQTICHQVKSYLAVVGLNTP